MGETREIMQLYKLSNAQMLPTVKKTSHLNYTVGADGSYSKVSGNDLINSFLWIFHSAVTDNRDYVCNAIQ